MYPTITQCTITTIIVGLLIIINNKHFLFLLIERYLKIYAPDHPFPSTRLTVVKIQTITMLSKQYTYNEETTRYIIDLI